MEQLIGQNGTDVSGLMGRPETVEAIPPGERWVYRTRHCVMNVTFYPEVESKKLLALNYEVTADDGSTEQQRQCMAKFSSRLLTKSAAN
jgi:hypothetical protein